MKISKEAKIATLAIIAIAILYFGLKFLKGSELFSSYKNFYVIYGEVDGLTPSNQVYINGYPVGQVDNISLMQERNNHLLVKLKVDNKVKVGESAAAVLITSDLLGGKAIELEVGNTSQPLEDGDTLIAKKEKGIAELVQEKSLPIIDKLDSTLIRVNFILGTVVKDTSRVANAMANLEQSTITVENILQENRQDLSATINNLRSLTASLSDANEGVGPLMAKLNHLADSLNNLKLQTTVNKLDQAAQNLQEITHKLNEGKGNIGRLVNEDSVYVNLNKTIEDLDRLLIDLRENPGRYINFSLIGGGKNK